MYSVTVTVSVCDAVLLANQACFAPRLPSIAAGCRRTSSSHASASASDQCRYVVYTSLVLNELQFVSMRHLSSAWERFQHGQNLPVYSSAYEPRKASCRWQTCATLAKSLHGLRKSSGVVSCIARLSIDSVPMVSYYVLYSNLVCKMRRFGDTRLLKLSWPWNPGQGSLKVIETDAIW